MLEAIAPKTLRHDGAKSVSMRDFASFAPLRENDLGAGEKADVDRARSARSRQGALLRSSVVTPRRQARKEEKNPQSECEIEL